jgi:riboflavin kinase/FMN adenylyltransferase
MVMPVVREIGPTCADEAARAELRALLRAQRAPCVATIGTFDGVHAGHAALVRRAATEARRRGVRVVAITFSPRPDTVVRPQRALPDICPLEERVERLSDAGADAVVVLPFTAELMRVSAAEFVRHLVEDLGMVALCVGEEFALGRGREGTVPALRELGLDVIAVPVLHVGGRPVKLSSSAIRRAIHGGVPPALARTGAAPVTGDVVPLDDARPPAPIARFSLMTA